MGLFGQKKLVRPSEGQKNPKNRPKVKISWSKHKIKLVIPTLWTIFLTFGPTGALFTNFDPNLLRRAFGVSAS